ncbi:hypothetical protein Poli38472_014765 [Pythium oligandrum]|uniref:Transmembrane protein n=1 Tax=Pythium oligandrum TaxID=41045 RepID=A0A8K1C230_PYTOL|nr:hypothetical protein Poli38472_014765 [Pythium oligandrum]|eukprot:TMW54994.1 hypothetical protein Poli38472_014765 [Pythium oligandrum]
MPSTGKSGFQLLERPAPSSTQRRGGRTLYLFLAFGALVIFGMISSEVSLAWMLKGSDESSTKSNQDQVLVVVPKTDVNATSEAPVNSTASLSMDNSTGLSTQIDTQRPEPTSVTPATGSCRPPTVDLSVFLDGHNDQLNPRFYAQLQRVHAATGLAGPPVFDAKHAFLCSVDANHTEKQWEQCLPIWGRSDIPYCLGADRRDLLVPQRSESRCFASVLHLLLLDVYATLNDVELEPALLYETLFGALRNGAMVPSSEKVELGYQNQSLNSLKVVQQRLWTKGYHMFQDDSSHWYVCVAPTHPLAANLFNPTGRAPVPSKTGPFVSLYAMQRTEAEAKWRVHTPSGEESFPQDQVQPYSFVRVNGLRFKTVAKPEAFIPRP